MVMTITYNVGFKKNVFGKFIYLYNNKICIHVSNYIKVQMNNNIKMIEKLEGFLNSKHVQIIEF